MKKKADEYEEKYTDLKSKFDKLFSQNGEMSAKM